MRRRDRLSAMDASLLHYVSEVGYNHGASLTIMEGDLPFDEFARDYELRAAIIPRFRQIAVPVPFKLAYPTWEYAPNYHIKNHLEHIELEAPGSMEQVRQKVVELFSYPLPMDQPYWSAHLIRGVEGNRTALFFKMAHAIVDGMGEEEIQRAFQMDLRSERIETGKAIPELPNAALRMWRGLRDNTITGLRVLAQAPRGIVGFARWLTSGAFGGSRQLSRAYSNAPALRFPFNIPSTPKINIAWTQFSIDEMKAIAAATGTKVNDVLLAIFARAGKLYAELHGLDPSGKFLKVHIPVSVRRKAESDKLGNITSIMAVHLPMDMADPVERTQAIAQITRANKEIGAPLATAFAIRAVLFCLTPIFAPMIQRRVASVQSQRKEMKKLSAPKVNMVVTNVPRGSEDMYVAHHKILSRFFLGPPPPHIGLTCAALTSHPYLCLAITAHADGAQDLDKLCAFLDQAYDEMRSSIAALSPREAASV